MQLKESNNTVTDQSKLIQGLQSKAISVEVGMQHTYDSVQQMKQELEKIEAKMDKKQKSILIRRQFKTIEDQLDDCKEKQKNLKSLLALLAQQQAKLSGAPALNILNICN